jgi:hypothetical protein
MPDRADVLAAMQTVGDGASSPEPWVAPRSEEAAAEHR